MIILSLKTDQKEAELGLFNDQKVIENYTYLADRNLANSIHEELLGLLKRHKFNWPDLVAIIVFEGPGSFTGLRIGITVGNTLAYSLNIPIVGAQGNDWQKKAIKALLAGENQKTVFPDYGAEPNTTQAKK